MPFYKADLHIHTLTSPCGSLEMSPKNIVDKALAQNLDIIAITDHNCTKQAPFIHQLGTSKGILVICGAEVNSSEEVHCLALFENFSQLENFQLFIDAHLVEIQNNPEYFGHQVVVDENEMIVEELPFLLTNALNVSLDKIEQKVHGLGGLLIPAHVDKPYNGLFSQLGFIPQHFNADAFELSSNASFDEWKRNGKLPSDKIIILNSDAHYPNQIGESCTLYELRTASFEELKKAMQNIDGRRVVECLKRKN